MNKQGRLFKYDISVPLEEWNTFIRAIHLAVEKAGFTIALSADSKQTEESYHLTKCSLIFSCFGHMGDENLHLNILLRYAPNL